MRTDTSFDVIVIGSGFGGSVMTCRLAEKGHRVCLLERGLRYEMHSFPRQLNDLHGIFWDPPVQKYGLYEFQAYKNSEIVTVSGSGLGGGSLIYAAALMRMPADHFQGWPGGITLKSLEPYYNEALRMLDGSPYPFAENPYYNDTERVPVLMDLSRKLVGADPDQTKIEFTLPPLGIRFKGSFPGQQRRNAHGRIQSSCIKCGECNIGCNIHAKNTLDLNYLARATNATALPTGARAATVITSREVVEIRPEKNGYIIVATDPTRPEETHTYQARRVVVSAGSLGSTRLLLQMKKRGLLPNISDALGRRWGGNGDTESTIYRTDKDIAPNSGPVITSAIQARYKPYPDGYAHSLVLQDAGYPTLLTWFLVGRFSFPRALARWLYFFVRTRWSQLRRGNLEQKGNALHAMMSFFIDRDDFSRKSLVMLGMGRDRTDGSLSLAEDGSLQVNWKSTASRLHFDRLETMMNKIAKAMGGKHVPNPLAFVNKSITVHPLGGCAMADDPNTGVVDSNGEVFGHKGLYVVDASILPTSVGVNPSLTIAAMAERIADFFPAHKENIGRRHRRPITTPSIKNHQRE